MQRVYPTGIWEHRQRTPRNNQKGGSQPDLEMGKRREQALPKSIVR